MYAELELSDRSPYVHLKIEIKPNSAAPDQAGGSYSQATGGYGCCCIVGVAILSCSKCLLGPSQSCSSCCCGGERMASYMEDVSKDGSWTASTVTPT